MFKDNQLDIKYFEFKTPINIDGVNYKAFGGIHFEYDVLIEDDDRGFIYSINNVNYNLFDVSLMSEDLFELEESSIDDKIIKILLNEIDPEDFSDRMIDKYLEHR